MTQLRYTNVAAPNLSGVGQLAQQASNSYAKAFESAGNVLGAFGKQRRGEEDSALLSQIAALSTDEEAVNFLNSSNVQGRNLSPAVLEALSQARDNIAARASVTAETDGRLTDNRYAPFVHEANLRLASANARGREIDNSFAPARNTASIDNTKAITRRTNIDSDFAPLLHGANLADMGATTQAKTIQNNLNLRYGSEDRATALRAARGNADYASARGNTAGSYFDNLTLGQTIENETASHGLTVAREFDRTDRANRATVEGAAASDASAAIEREKELHDTKIASLTAATGLTETQVRQAEIAIQQSPERFQEFLATARLDREKTNLLMEGLALDNSFAADNNEAALESQRVITEGNRIKNRTIVPESEARVASSRAADALRRAQTSAITSETTRAEGQASLTLQNRQRLATAQNMVAETINDPSLTSLEEVRKTLFENPNVRGNIPMMQAIEQALQDVPNTYTGSQFLTASTPTALSASLNALRQSAIQEAGSHAGVRFLTTVEDLSGAEQEGEEAFANRLRSLADIPERFSTADILATIGRVAERHPGITRAQAAGLITVNANDDLGWTIFGPGTEGEYNNSGVDDSYRGLIANGNLASAQHVRDSVSRATDRASALEAAYISAASQLRTFDIRNSGDLSPQQTALRARLQEATDSAYANALAASSEGISIGGSGTLGNTNAPFGTNTSPDLSAFTASPRQPTQPTNPNPDEPSPQPVPTTNTSNGLQRKGIPPATSMEDLDSRIQFPSQDDAYAAASLRYRMEVLANSGGLGTPEYAALLSEYNRILAASNSSRP